MNRPQNQRSLYRIIRNRGD